MHLAGDLSDACKLVARVKALMDFAIQLPTTTTPSCCSVILIGQHGCLKVSPANTHCLQMLHAADADLEAKVQLMTLNASSKLPSAALPLVCTDLVELHLSKPV